MNIQLQEIANDLTGAYRDDKNVLCIALFGSAAKHQDDAFSDIDIYIVLKKRAKSSRINFLREGKKVDVILSTLKETVEYLDSDKGSLKRVTSDMLANAVVLFDRADTLKKLIKVAKENLRIKTKYTKKEILMHKYSIDDFLGEAQRDAAIGDDLAFAMDSQLLINNVLELCFKMKGLVLPQPNKIKDILGRIDGPLSALIDELYAKSDPSEKCEVLIKIVGRVYGITGGELPDRWSV
jgi:predicted nucleotidyltransferase